jgi:hypothetical protein
MPRPKKLKDTSIVVSKTKTTRKPKTKQEPKPEPSLSMAPAGAEIEKKNGLVMGEYSRSFYDNGTLISFEIDWHRLAKYMQNLDR